MGFQASESYPQAAHHKPNLVDSDQVQDDFAQEMTTKRVTISNVSAAAKANPPSPKPGALGLLRDIALRVQLVPVDVSLINLLGKRRTEETARLFTRRLARDNERNAPCNTMRG